MLEIIDYKIISSCTEDSLTERVNNAIYCNWQPLGPVQVATSGTNNNYFNYIQTLVKYKQPQIKELQ